MTTSANKTIGNKKLGIILVVTNEKHNLKMLYKSLAAQSFKNFTIYFVDNNSIDGSTDYSKILAEQFDLDIKYIQLDGNYGFAKGNNIGAELAIKDECDYLFVLNNDTELDKECLFELVNLAESDKNIGIVGPIFFYWNEHKSKSKIQLYGAKVNFNNQKTELIAANKYFEEISLPEVMEVDYVSGGTTLLKREVVEKVGLFEEKYFIYNDEIDLAYRVKCLNYKTVVTTKAKVWHNHDWTKKNKAKHYFQYYYMNRNYILYFKKYNLKKELIKYLFAELLTLPFKVKWALNFAGVKFIKYYYLGILKGLTGECGKTKIQFN